MATPSKKEHSNLVTNLELYYACNPKSPPELGGASSGANVTMGKRKAKFGASTMSQSGMANVMSGANAKKN